MSRLKGSHFGLRVPWKIRNTVETDERRMRSLEHADHVVVNLSGTEGRSICQQESPQERFRQQHTVDASPLRLGVNRVLVEEK
jgi:hypothetical protein